MPSFNTAALTVLGLDPGYGRLGWGVIVLHHDEYSVDYGCMETSKDLPSSERLAYLFNKTRALVQRFKPDLLALEQIFFSKNAKTAIAVAEVRGTLLLLAAQERLPIHSFTPPHVKQAVTGYGGAQKQQMQIMMQTLLRLKEPIQSDDAADALALAWTALRKHQWDVATQKRVY